jgi:hypothetical protein
MPVRYLSNGRNLKDHSLSVSAISDLNCRLRRRARLRRANVSPEGSSELSPRLSAAEPWGHGESDNPAPRQGSEDNWTALVIHRATVGHLITPLIAQFFQVLVVHTEEVRHFVNDCGLDFIFDFFNRVAFIFDFVLENQNAVGM